MRAISGISEINLSFSPSVVFQNASWRSWKTSCSADGISRVCQWRIRTGLLGTSVRRDVKEARHPSFNVVVRGTEGVQGTIAKILGFRCRILETARRLLILLSSVWTKRREGESRDRPSGTDKMTLGQKSQYRGSLSNKSDATNTQASAIPELPMKRVLYPLALLMLLWHRFVVFWKRARRRLAFRIIRHAAAYLLGLYCFLTSSSRRALASAGEEASTLIGSAGAVHSASGGNAPQTYLVLAAVMFLFGAALAAAETAITTLWPWKVRELAAAEGEGSPFAILQADLTRFLTTILVTTTSATIFSTAIATDHAARIFGNANIAYVTFIMTVLFLFFGEILPKALAVHAPARVARFMVPYIRGLSVIVYPIGKLLASVSSFILKLFNLQMESDIAVSEQELRLIVAGADRSGSIEKYESRIIRNVLDLEEMYVREVMRPRVDIVALPEESTLFDFLKTENESHYSRIPVFKSTVDNITGIVYAKSLLQFFLEDEDIQKILSTTRVKEIAEAPYFVPESMSVWNVLEEMRKRRLHLAIVVDEYGGTSGLVTLEDILEEVIYDECDDVEDSAEAEGIKEVDSTTFEIDGQADLDLVGEVLGLKIDEEDLKEYGTISGYLCDEMDGIPDIGDEIVVSGVRFQVTEADDRRILQVTANRLSETEIRVLEKAHNTHENVTLVDSKEYSTKGGRHVRSNAARHERDGKPELPMKEFQGGRAAGSRGVGSIRARESNGDVSGMRNNEEVGDGV